MVLLDDHHRAMAEGALNQADIDRLTDRADRVEIFRDGFGVPHIYAPTDADAVFGMLTHKRKMTSNGLNKTIFGRPVSWRV